MRSSCTAMSLRSPRPSCKYHVALEKAADEPGFDPAEIAALVPPDRFAEFSYASELVTHDGAIGALLSSAEALRKTKDQLPGTWGQCLAWIDARLARYPVRIV
jgi:hypothetical protein